MRRLELHAPDLIDRFEATLARHEARSCLDALVAAVALYRLLRDEAATPGLVRRSRAEEQAMAFVEEVRIGV